MDTSTNPKKRRDSVDSITEREGKKKQCKKKRRGEEKNSVKTKTCHQKQFHSALHKLYQYHPHNPHHLIPLKPSKPSSTQHCPPSHLSYPTNCSPGLFLRLDTIDPQKSPKHRKEPSRFQRKTDKH